mmetsp:Transcript_16846/g.32915  ORF Transcript_16846/g.32915 Transcript_16846/m.32915 type:complete len:638 (+) Transcript_16846:95-2008(+)
MISHGAGSPRIEWARRTPRSDLAWGITFGMSVVLWIAIAGWLMSAVNVTTGFEPVGSLAKQVKECKATKGFGHEASSVAAALAGKARLWAIFQKHWILPLGSLGLVAVLSFVWLASLQSCGFAAVWGTMLIKTVALLFLAIKSADYGFDRLSTACWVAGIFLAIVTLWQYKNINLSARILTKVGAGIRQSAGATWCAALFLQVLFVIAFLLFTWVSACSFYVWELRRTESGLCTLARSELARDLHILSALLYAWIAAYLRAARTLVVGVPIIAWYYPAVLAVDNAPSTPALAALGWSFSSSAGTLSIAGLIAAMAAKAEQAATARRNTWCGDAPRCCSCDCLNPIGMLFQLIWYLMESFAVTATRFALLAHIFTSRGFCTSASAAYRTMGRRGTVGGYIVAQAGESVVTMGAYVFSLVVGMAAWEYVDKIEGYDTLNTTSHNVYGEVLFYLLVVLYGILTYYPTATLIGTVVVSAYLPGWATPFLTALFIASAVHLIFGFIGEIILVATNAIYFCYCLDIDLHNEQRSLPAPRSPIYAGASEVEPPRKEQIELHALFCELEATSVNMPEPSAPELSHSDEDEWMPAWGVVSGVAGAPPGDPEDPREQWQRTGGMVETSSASRGGRGPGGDAKNYRTF